MASRVARTAASYILWPIVGFTATALLLRIGVPVQTALAIIGAYLALDWAVETAIRTRRRRR